MAESGGGALAESSSRGSGGSGSSSGAVATAAAAAAVAAAASGGDSGGNSSGYGDYGDYGESVEAALRAPVPSSVLARDLARLGAVAYPWGGAAGAAAHAGLVTLHAALEV
jgi:hypothetical protein